MMTGAVSQYVGAAMAVGVFATLGVLAVAWLRVSWSAIMLLAWRRPRLGRFDRAARRQLAIFGTTLAFMNLAFYLAIERLPLGTAVAIEFSGPIAVAALGGRGGGGGRGGARRRQLLAVVLAVAAVMLLADLQWQASADGVTFALAAAVMWAGYIVWGRRVGGGGVSRGLDGLALATVFGALALAPLGLVGLVAALSGGGGKAQTNLAGAARSLELAPAVAVLACAAVALCSNVVPYALDQVVLARLAAAPFALLSTLLPATAVLVGVVALGQRPTAAELLGITLVVAALAVGATVSADGSEAAASG